MFGRGLEKNFFSPFQNKKINMKMAFHGGGYNIFERNSYEICYFLLSLEGKWKRECWIKKVTIVVKALGK